MSAPLTEWADPFQQVVRYRFEKWPDDPGTIVRFRLIYDGPLPAASSGNRSKVVRVKHAIRKQLHPQLRELWNSHPAVSLRNHRAEIARHYARHGFNWLPLITEGNGVACALDILFLRRDAPGAVVRHGGDLDNRLKTLFDALRLPDHPPDIGEAVPGSDEDPFYCLLEDDALITDIHIRTDRLLRPVTSESDVNDVVLVINVQTKLVKDEATGFYIIDSATHVE